MTDHTYAGHTLAEIKSAAEEATPGPWEALSNIVRTDMRTTHGFLVTECPASIGNRLNDASHIAIANPATVLAMAARIEELERERDAAIEARREAQTETQLAREDRNRAGIEARRGMFKLIKEARLEGWQAAREQAAKLCADQKQIRGSMGERFIAGKCEEHTRAMQPPVEWQCAEVAPVCGAAPNVESGILTNEGTKPESLCKTCLRANVSCPVYPQDTQHCVEHAPAWPHNDGFGGGTD